MVEAEQVIKGLQPHAHRVGVPAAHRQPADELVERREHVALGTTLPQHRGTAAERLAREDAMDIDPPQTEDAGHPGHRRDRIEVRRDRVEDRPVAFGAKVVHVKRELFAVRRIDHDHLRLRVLVEVDAGLVHELASQSDTL
jgi:hypothetical protein